MLRKLRKQNPSLFDLVLFIGFTTFSFGSYVLADAAGVSGAVIGISLLTITCLAMVFSR
jgi:hypothetical protein